MKLRVVAWLTPYCGAESGEFTWAARNAIIDEIRKHGYEFSGMTHGERYGTVPILNNGKKYLYSSRGWGDLMAEAHGHTGHMDYCLYSFQMDNEVLPDTDLNECQYCTVEELEEVFDFDEDDVKYGYRDETIRDLVLKPETDLNERIEIAVTQEVIDCAESEGEIKLPVLDGLRYLGEGDTLALTCAGKTVEYTVLDAVRKRDMSEERLNGLLRETYHFEDRERVKRAQDEIDGAKFVLQIKLQKTTE